MLSITSLQLDEGAKKAVTAFRLCLTNASKAVQQLATVMILPDQ
jgi:hypothetical protein